MSWVAVGVGISAVSTSRGFEKLRVAIIPVKGTELDLHSASGRMVANMLGEIDAYESDLKGERVSRAHEEAAIQGKVEDKVALMKALRGVNAQTVRGPVSFDNYGNVVGDVFIRRVERKENRLVNTVQYTYPNVNQFWDMKPEEFLKNPVYSRDYPPARNLES